MTNERVMIDGELREVIPCPDNKPDCEVLHTKPVRADLAGAGAASGVIEGPSSTEYEAWLETRPDLTARFETDTFKRTTGYEIWRNAWLRLRELYPTPAPPSAAAPLEISDNPTLEEAEAYLRASGIDPKDVTNEFIERLLGENLRLKQQLAKVDVTPSVAAVDAARIDDAVETLRQIRELVKSSRSWVPQDNAAEMILRLEELGFGTQEGRRGNTLWAMVMDAADEIANLRAVTPSVPSAVVEDERYKNESERPTDCICLSTFKDYQTHTSDCPVYTRGKTSGSAPSGEVEEQG